MKLTDKLWTNKWSKVIYENFFYGEFRQRWGTDEEPYSSLWLSSLSEAVGSNFKEHMKVLDYGCGGGRYLNFISQRLNNFTYYGLERSEGESSHAIRELMEIIVDNDMAKFGFIGSDLEKEALNVVDVVILGSIFTHLKFQCENESPEGDSFITICDKFKPIMDRGGVISFSVFIGDNVDVIGDGNVYGVENCYPLSYYTLDVMKNYCKPRNLKLTEYGSFIAQGVHEHRIFRMEKNI